MIILSVDIQKLASLAMKKAFLKMMKLRRMNFFEILRTLFRIIPVSLKVDAMAKIPTPIIEFIMPQK